MERSSLLFLQVPAFLIWVKFVFFREEGKQTVPSPGVVGADRQQHVKAFAMSTAPKKGPLKGALKSGSNLNASSGSNLKSKTGAGKVKSSVGGGHSSRKSGMSASQVGDGRSGHSLIVRDPDNPELDVTPLSLLDAVEPSVVANMSEDGGKGSITPRSGGSSHAGLDAGSGWGSGASTPRMEEDEGLYEGGVEVQRKGRSKPVPSVSMLQDEFPTKPAEVKREKEREITVTLTETQTFLFFDIPSSCVADDDENLKKVQAENAAYTEFVKAKAGQDKYSDRAIQTLNMACKNKDAQATPVATASVGCEATNYEIHDAIELLKAGESVVEDDMGVGASNKAAGDSLASLTGNTGGDTAAKAVLESGKFQHALMAAERIVMQNIYHEKQVMYRQPPAPEDLSASKGRAAKLEELFSFKCALTEGRTVTCMSWNRLNGDLLAVGYGSLDFSKQSDGLVLFWSVKNPEYPHKIYRTECTVTSVAFASKAANLLAVGLYDGTVGVYDVRKAEDECVLESSFTTGKHSDAVWELVWLNKGPERGEALVSVSADGRVTQWTMSKGLEYSDLIKLKRVASHKKAGGGAGTAAHNKKEAFISRMASGMCADFNSKDASLYVVGTEEGNVHKCSVSYNEQYLETYMGHSGPVYKVAWSPFVSSAFLSCSADWTIRVWHQDVTRPMLTLQSSADFVADLQWSPANSTIFASVTGDGLVSTHALSAHPHCAVDGFVGLSLSTPRCRTHRCVDACRRYRILTHSGGNALVIVGVQVNVWDMSISTLDPIVSEKRENLATGEVC